MRLIISDSFQDESTILSSRETRSESEASLELVVAELQHRIRNLLSVVECVVTSTDAGTANDYRKAIAARIEALSDAVVFLEKARESRVSLGMQLEAT